MRLTRAWIVLTVAATIVAFDAATGDVLWTEQVGFSQASGTTVSNGRLFVTHGFQFLQIIQAAPGMEGGLRVYGFK